MGIFSRISNMTKAKANEILDNVEDPILLCNQKIRDMEKSLKEAQLSSAQVIGNANEIKNKVDKAKQEVDLWEERVKSAVSKGNDDLAKKALAKKLEAEKNYNSLVGSYKIAREQADVLKERLQKLSQEIQDTREKRDQLEARLKTAEASQRVNEIVANVSSKKNEISLDDIERKVSKKEALADGIGELASMKKDPIEDEFACLDSEVDLDAELAKYKG